MTHLFSFVDRMSTWVAWFAALGILLLMATLSLEVVMRYGFDSPTAWSFDASYFINSFVVIAGAAYTLKLDAHVRVDIIYANLPKRVRAGLNGVLMLLIFVPLWAVLLYSMWPNVVSSWQTGEKSAMGTWLPPLYPFKAWVFLGLLLLLLQGCVVAARDIGEAVGRRPS